MAPIHPSTTALAPTTATHPQHRATSATTPEAPAPPISDPDSSPSKKRKRKEEKPHTLYTTTFRKSLWTYTHLRLSVPTLLPPSPSSPTTASLDPLTVRSLLTPPLQAFLGLHGSSMPIDVLKTHNLDVWLRIQREDGRVLRAALSTWTGSCDAEMVPGCEGKGDKWGRVKVAWRVVGQADVLGLLEGDGSDLFGG